MPTQPHTTPLTSPDDVITGRLYLHCLYGVGRCHSISHASEMERSHISLNFAEGTGILVSFDRLTEIQLIHVEGRQQPLLDRLGFKQVEWMQFLERVRTDTLFDHYKSSLPKDVTLSSGQLVWHPRYGVAKYCEPNEEDVPNPKTLEFANGWRHTLTTSEWSSLELINLDPASDRQPQLDPFPKQTYQWDSYLRKERRRAKTISEVSKLTATKRIMIRESVRHEVWRRDQGMCVRCGSRLKLEFDHIVPLSKGGSDTARNIELLCENCNRSKGARI